MKSASQSVDMQSSVTSGPEMSLSDVIADRLREAIISGAFMPGRPLVESRLCETHQASRNTIREALRQLRSEGLVINIRNRGAQVRTLTLADVHDIYKVRHALELSAIEQSGFASAFLFERISAVITSSEQAVLHKDWNKVGTRSLNFHQAVVGLLGSERLDAYFSIIVAQLRLVFSLSADEESFQTGWTAKDRQIHDYLLSGQRKAAADAMKLYLKESEARMVDLVRSVSGQPMMTK
ncbi:GntR family transcriptional regulator [Modicisalibacter luteus]|uniref:GntR family transcriptional regulator n=1 Tax=Modicisalibacter luteus TaxID=453962 RepID=A0ABV7M3Z5_9GAMM|nr:GntR family transcriptional regulator [Halomonas lutea]GHA88178.1 GntR family transcriptional regulator [Halomonas lutea]